MTFHKFQKLHTGTNEENENVFHDQSRFKTENENGNDERKFHYTLECQKFSCLRIKKV